MGDQDRITTADGRVLTDAAAAAHAAIVKRISWASLHWGTESVSPEAWPHIAMAATAAVREQIAAEVEAEAERRAAKRDEHRAIAIARRIAGKELAAETHMRTAHSFRSEATGMWDAARIARGEVSS